MARTKGPSRKSVTVGLSEKVFLLADEHRWSMRMSLSEFVNHAVSEFLAAEGFDVTEPAETAEPAEAPEPEKAKKA